jgi:hypothetical protein
VKFALSVLLAAGTALAQDASVAQDAAVAPVSLPIPPPSSPIASANLLSVARVVKADGVQRVEVITDGQAATDGETWNSVMAAIIPSKGEVVWDLGQQVPIEAGLIQGDNNDNYLIWGSDDGTSWNLIWKAGPYSNDGLRTRTQSGLNAKARFIKVTGEGGDNLYSVGELQLYASGATLSNPPLARKLPPPPPPAPFNPSWLVLAVLAVGMFMFFTRRKPTPEAKPAEKPADAPKS